MSSPAALRVFISYSSRDADLVEGLKTALAQAGVAVWLDHEQLTPGTRNWQIKVRDGIAQATCVVYAASETAALSEFVYDEISIARNKGKTVIPFWVRGAEWHDCAPLGFGATQHIDARDAAWAAGLTRLLATLGATGASSAAPTPAAPPIAAPQPRYPLPAVPPRLTSLGFQGVNPHGTPAIIPPLVSVAAGPFLMGSDKQRDPQADDDETPLGWVELAGFSIGKYPVTVAEYGCFLTATGHARPASRWNRLTWEEQGRERLDHPVVNVSWQDVQAYLKWLRAAANEPGWRLPTEAEWEKAARWDPRANASRLYPWGDSFDKHRCNTSESGIGHTTPVGSYPASDARRSGASPWGAEDMAGNVWEWTSSLYQPYPYTVTDGREALDSIGTRTLRGGSWLINAGYARAAFRLNDWWVNRFDIRGFRLVLAASAGS